MAARFLLFISRKKSVTPVSLVSQPVSNFGSNSNVLLTHTQTQGKENMKNMRHDSTTTGNNGG